MSIPVVGFFVQGEPRPKQSFRISGKGGYTPARVKAWQTDVAVEAERAMRRIGRFSQPYETGEFAVSLRFFLGNSRRVDLDNLSKAVLDGMKGIIFGDDQQVVILHLEKVVVNKKKEAIGVDIDIHKPSRKSKASS